MPKFRVKIAENDFELLQRLVFADLPKEAGAFALAGVAVGHDRTDIIVRRALEVPKEHFTTQHEHRLEIAPQAINGLVALCERNGLGAILCHSHPADIPYSLSDDYGEKRVFDVLRKFIPARAPTASLLFYPGGVRGRVWVPDQNEAVPIKEVVVVGRRCQIFAEGGQEDAEDVSGVFDRQVRVFGVAGQRTIARTKVAVVGVGGTGSPTAEQLVRLGVRDLVLIDPDHFDPSNLTRVYGTFPSGLGETWWHFRKQIPLKVELVAKHLRRIRPKATIAAVPSNVVQRDAAQHILDRDIVFLCMDDHWGRSIVNQIAYQYFIPTVNMGVRIAAKEGQISGGAGSIDVLRPDNPCLWCSQFLGADRIAAESMPRKERVSLEREGYVENIDTPAPSVVSMTTALSGIAVSLFLQLVTDFMGPGGNIARLNYDIMDSTVRRGRATIPRECLCKKVRGCGDLKALPTLFDLSYLKE
jgi:molybdopterin/thiamine biosynthesis adenylyltransferase